MRSSHSLNRLGTAFDDDRLVADAGLLLPATLAQHLGLKELVNEHLDLGKAPGRANVGAHLLTRAWTAGAGPGDAPFTIDLDSTICETYGLKKQGALHHGYTHVRGYHPLLAVAAGAGGGGLGRPPRGRSRKTPGSRSRTGSTAAPMLPSPPTPRSPTRGTRSRSGSSSGGSDPPR